ncbi:hypothetical protein C8J56DRAFT_900123 [Mycena floridula]|nr:hypothetical protein C8J56DRAFT_900123 [Mycena floridula]
MARGPNQYLPTPPPSLMDPWLKYYFKLGLMDKLIAHHVLDHFEMDKYGLSAKSVQRARKRLNLLSARQQLVEWSDEDFMPIYTQVGLRFPSLGCRGMVTHVRLHYDLGLPDSFPVHFAVSETPHGSRVQDISGEVVMMARDDELKTGQASVSISAALDFHFCNEFRRSRCFNEVGLR